MLNHSLTLAAWFHDLSPFAIRFTDTFGVRWYGLSYALGFLFAYLLMRRLSARAYTPLRTDQLGDMILTLILGVVVGGRLGYIAFYQPSLLWTFQDGVPFWGVLQINKGGMASHGGMIGVIALACWWVRRINKQRAGQSLPPVSMLHVLDVCALAFRPGWAWGVWRTSSTANCWERSSRDPASPRPGGRCGFPGGRQRARDRSDGPAAA
jgi:prolipoprotein diacylglyceryl transferase